MTVKKISDAAADIMFGPTADDYNPLWHTKLLDQHFAALTAGRVAPSPERSDGITLIRQELELRFAEFDAAVINAGNTITDLIRGMA